MPSLLTVCVFVGPGIRMGWVAEEVRGGASPYVVA